MSRPIPEGVELPHPNATILGWGGEFKPLPEERAFRGWQFYPYLGSWRESNFEGWDDDAIYAADRESEVALLNRKPVPLNRGESYSSEATDKDALIRELVKSLQGMMNEESPGDLWLPHCMEAERVLTLARTTCPEAFEEIQEQTQIDTI